MTHAWKAAALRTRQDAATGAGGEAKLAPCCVYR